MCLPRNLIAICYLALVSALLTPQAARSSESTVVLTKVDGSQHRGRLVTWNAREITLESDGQKSIVRSQDLLRMNWPNNRMSEPADSRLIELVDGTRLPHDSFIVESGRATFTSLLSDQPLEISTGQIRFVQLDPEFDWLGLAEQEPDGDMLVIRKKNSGKFDKLSGVIGDVSSGQVAFNWDGETIPVKRTKVAALSYYHSDEAKHKQPAFWLNLSGGVRLPIATLELSAGIAEVSSIAGLTFSIPSEMLREADYSNGKLTYLSDLKPLQQLWTPRINLPMSAELIREHGLPRHDQSFAGSAITLSWPPAKPKGAKSLVKIYDKGLAIRSRSELRYRIPVGMKRFVTLAGIDPETAQEGHVTLEIFAGRRSVWKGEIDGSAAPVEIDVPLGTAREFRILVDYGENLDFGDRLHLAEARLSQ